MTFSTSWKERRQLGGIPDPHHQLMFSSEYGLGDDGSSERLSLTVFAPDQPTLRDEKLTTKCWDLPDLPQWLDSIESSTYFRLAMSKPAWRFQFSIETVG